MARISLAQTYHYYLVGTHKVSLVVGKGLICLSKFGGDQSPRPYTFRWPLLSKGTHFFSVYLPLLKMTLLSTLAIRYATLGFLAKISFTPLLYHPGGCLGCPEKRTRSRNYNFFVWSAVFQPKWNSVSFF